VRGITESEIEERREGPKQWPWRRRTEVEVEDQVEREVGERMLLFMNFMRVESVRLLEAEMAWSLASF